jgi:hypothetical protein
MHKRARQRNTLRHAAGKVTRPCALESLQAHQVDHLLRSEARRAGAGNRPDSRSVHLKRKHDVLECGAPGHEIRLLENHANARPPLSAKDDLSAAGRDEPRDRPQQRCLARARGAKNTEELAGAQVE